MKIISEVGSNWSTLHDCLKSIELSKEAGADIVKFQLFTPEELYGPNSYAKMELLEHSMPRHWIPQLKEHADKCGIEFMCTAFSPEGYKFIDPFVKRHKIASCEVWDTEIINTVCSFGKEYLISTGAVESYQELRDLIKKHDNTSAIIMFCEGSYPAKVTKWTWYSAILQDIGGAEFGLSDHSLDLFTNPTMAKNHGMAYLEKHANFVDAKGPDAHHSLNFKEFQTMVNSLRDDVLGKENDFMPSLHNHSRCLIATKKIKAGEYLLPSTCDSGQKNIAFFRPTDPECFGIRELLPLATKAKVDINEGDIITEAKVMQ